MLLPALILLLFRVSCSSATTDIETIHRTSSYVLHMEIDVTNNDRLIYSEIESLRVLDLVTMEDTIIAGDERQTGYKEGNGQEVRFSRVSAFIQSANTHFVVADMMNHCLRTVYRNGTTQAYVGKCTRLGLKYGSFADTRFISPIRIRQCGDFLYMLDHGVDAVIKIDTVAQMTYKLVEDSRMSYPRDMLFFDSCSTVYVTFSDSIMNMSLPEGPTHLLTSNITGSSYPSFRNGLLSASKFHNPVEILSITEDIFLVADNSNNRLRIVSRRLQQVKSVCAGQLGYVDGSVNTCRLFSPWSLAVSNDRKLVYVGEFEAIRQVKMDSLLELLEDNAVVG